MKSIWMQYHQKKDVPMKRRFSFSWGMALHESTMNCSCAENKKMMKRKKMTKLKGNIGSDFEQSLLMMKTSISLQLLVADSDPSFLPFHSVRDILFCVLIGTAAPTNHRIEVIVNITYE